MSGERTSETIDIPTVSLPTVNMRPTGDHNRTIASPWIGRPQVHSDDDGNSYLVVACQYMDVSIGFGEGSAGIPDMEQIVKLLQERIAEIREMEA